MVYEFYANAKSMEGEIVTVRGKDVDFSAERISDMFNLEDQSHDDYAEILNKFSLKDIYNGYSVLHTNTGVGE
ncbi:hypothetical protein KSP39_PZI020484 [Platanthera zijinensis]|uniref:Uncharacterized protein n=1 Tax=Platanthera zijinensis TaxID=2320716 RepID=A0AAP0B0D6_9ASPA